MINFWLGAEYNQKYKDTKSTHDLMRQYLRSGFINNNISFFERLKTQVSCFGDPDDFYYDDVSQIKAGGTHSNIEQYEKNVIESVEYHINLFKNHKPRIILISGSQAFVQYCRHVLPKLDIDNLVIVKIRNPSRQAHRGNWDKWLEKYKRFGKADLSHSTGLTVLHLRCSNIEDHFSLIELSK